MATDRRRRPSNAEIVEQIFERIRATRNFDSANTSGRRFTVAPNGGWYLNCRRPLRSVFSLPLVRQGSLRWLAAQPRALEET